MTEHYGQSDVMVAERETDGPQDGVIVRVAELRSVLEILDRRVNSVYAHHHSLDRAAHGLDVIARRLEVTLQERLVQAGASPGISTTHATIAAMREHLDMVLPPEHRLPLEQRRQHLNHVLFRINTALEFLGSE